MPSAGDEIKRLCKRICENSGESNRGVIILSGVEVEGSVRGRFFPPDSQRGLALIRGHVLPCNMPKISTALWLGIALIVTGCSGTNGLTVGTDPDAQPNGSYSGSTLNSPVTDQNPHPGATVFKK